MALADLLVQLEQRADTSDTPCNPGGVSAKPAPIKACTLDTPDTPQNCNDRSADVETDTATAERLEQAIGVLQSDPGLRYAMETHAEVEADAVIVTLAIRDKAACEIRIPKSRYDGLALLELIEKHTTRETLQ